MSIVEPTAQARMNPPQVETIPAELKAKAQWVSWRYEERTGKPTKGAVAPRTGLSASSMEPADGASLNAVLWLGSDQGITVLSEYRLAPASQGATAKRARQHISRPLRDQAQARRGYVIDMQQTVTHAHANGLALQSVPPCLTQHGRWPEYACQICGPAVTAMAALHSAGLAVRRLPPILLPCLPVIEVSREPLPQ